MLLFGKNTKMESFLSTRSIKLSYVGDVLQRKSFIWKHRVPFLWYLKWGHFDQYGYWVKWRWDGNTTYCSYSSNETIQLLLFDCQIAIFMWNVMFITFGIQPCTSLANHFGSWHLYVSSMFLGIMQPLMAPKLTPFSNNHQRSVLGITVVFLLKEDDRNKVNEGCILLEATNLDVLSKVLSKVGWNMKKILEA